MRITCQFLAGAVNHSLVSNFLKNGLLLWQENQRSPKRLDRNTRSDESVVASCADDQEASTANLAFVGSAFATLLTED
jgi:hypothetical protein